MDNMTGKRHSANSELLGQGLGNLVAPFFGGITATAAIARSAANFRAGRKHLWRAWCMRWWCYWVWWVWPCIGLFAHARYGGAINGGGLEYERSA